jgi:membrane protein involved in colicin uptake
MTREEKDSMSEKVALPSLSLPKQKTHWSVGVVIAAGVLFLVLVGILYFVHQRQVSAEEAFARRVEDQKSMIKAETERAKAETEKAKAEAKRKEAETAAAAAAAAAQKKVVTSAVTEDDGTGAKKKKVVHKGTKTASKGGTATAPALPGTPAGPAAKPATKASKDIDDLLKGFK